jgi:hypothetical protein
MFTVIVMYDDDVLTLQRLDRSQGARFPDTGETRDPFNRRKSPARFVGVGRDYHPYGDQIDTKISFLQVFSDWQEDAPAHDAPPEFSEAG